MEDFDDIPDPLHASPPEVQAPRVRLQGSPPTRREIGRRRWLALLASGAWIAVQFAAFGVRGDLARIPAWYLAALVAAPLGMGFSAIVLSLHPGKLGLGARVATVMALALLAPASFLLAALVAPSPYEGGQTGGVMFGAYCLDGTLAMATLPLIAAALVLRSAFAAGAVWRSALLGGGCGLIGAALFTLHCPVVDHLHVALGHGGAVLVTALAGGFLLSRATRL